ncbi:hypothetical protein ACFQ60_30650 [Streptomyces zhihengii]
MTTALVPALVLGLAACQGPAGPGPGASGEGGKRAAATAPGVARIGDTADDRGTRSGSICASPCADTWTPPSGSAPRRARRAASRSPRARAPCAAPPTAPAGWASTSP